MSGGVKQQLAGVAVTSTGSHKDQSDKYRNILECILQSPQSPELVENLKALVDQSKGGHVIRIFKVWRELNIVLILFCFDLFLFFSGQ